MAKNKITIKSPYQKVRNKDIQKAVSDNALKQLKKQAKPLFSKLNKRIRNIEKQYNTDKEFYSPAYEALKDKGIKSFSYATNNIQELDKIYRMALSFDNMKTSNVANSKKWTQELINNTGISNPTERKDYVGFLFDVLRGVHERLPDRIYQNSLKYESYMEAVVNTVKENDYNTFSKEEREDAITKAINQLTDEISDTYNQSIHNFEHKINIW